MLPPPNASTPSVLVKAKNAYSSWLVVFNDFPKVYRATFAKKIDMYFLELLESIFISLYLPPQEKMSMLTAAIGKLDGVKFFLQLAWENKCVALQRYTTLSAQLNEIGRMIGGWKKGLEHKTPAIRREKQ